MPELDQFDRAILSALQEDSKLSLAEIAERAGLSTSPCWRRIKALEEAGVIDRYVAVLNPKALGLDAQAYVQVSLIDHTEASVERFDRFVAAEDRIVECASITGTADYLLKVVAHDPEELESFMMKSLLATGLVRNSATNFILRRIKNRTALPLGGAI